MADPSKAGVLDAHTARIVAAKALGVFAASLYRLFEAADKSDSDGELGGTPAWRDRACEQLTNFARTGGRCEH